MDPGGASVRLRAAAPSLPPDVARDLLAVLEHVQHLDEQLAELELLHSITVEASTALENELSLRNEVVTGFLANTSHEIRTPLNGIIGQAELVMEELKEQGNLHHHADLERIRGAGRHLLSVVNDILDLSKVEAGRLELRPEEVHLMLVVDDVVESCGPIANRNDVDLRAEVGNDVGLIEADPVRLRQCLLNLVSNACKFSPNGQVRIRVWRERDVHTDNIFISVSDTGIGIPSDQLDRVFEPYHQAHTGMSRSFGGTGLGLTFTRSLCRRMGGDVRAESTPGRGSTFTLRLPARFQR